MPCFDFVELAPWTYDRDRDCEIACHSRKPGKDMLQFCNTHHFRRTQRRGGDLFQKDGGSP